MIGFGAYKGGMSHPGPQYLTAKAQGHPSLLELQGPPGPSFWGPWGFDATRQPPFGPGAAAGTPGPGAHPRRVMIDPRPAPAWRPRLSEHRRRRAVQAWRGPASPPPQGAAPVLPGKGVRGTAVATTTKLTGCQSPPKIFFFHFSGFVCFCFLGFFLRVGLTVHFRLSLNSLCSPEPRLP